MTQEVTQSSKSSALGGSIIRSTLIVMGGLAASIVIGLIRQPAAVGRKTRVGFVELGYEEGFRFWVILC